MLDSGAFRETLEYLKSGPFEKYRGGCGRFHAISSFLSIYCSQTVVSWEGSSVKFRGL